MVKLDLAGFIVFFAGLLVFPWLGYRFWGRVTGVFRAIAVRPWAAMLTTGAVCIAANGAVALYHGIPLAMITDESSYLLGADTFLKGRLTNPPHPLWEHFESQHIIQQPTYQSKFPPAQALFLAFGKLVGRHAIAGVWISLALACAGLVWMLQAWVGPDWALFGGLLAAVSPSLIKGWGQTYWGGAVAMLGGALLFGAVRRIVREPRPRDAVIMGVGLAILANSRPFEGMIAGLVAAVILLFWVVRGPRPTPGVLFRKVAVPALLVLGVTGIWMVYYNYRVTHDPLLMPYQIWHGTYRTGGIVFDKGTGVAKDTAASPQATSPKKTEKGATVGKGGKAGQGGQGPKRRLAGTQGLGKSKGRWRMLQFDAVFFVPGILALALLGLPWALCDRWAWFALAGSAIVIGSVFLQGTTIFAPHYLAPVAALCFALIVLSLRRLHALRWQRYRPGKWIVRGMACGFVVAAVVGMINWVPIPRNLRWVEGREKVIARLKATPEKDLVIVHYIPKRKVKREWVYNEPDIDASQVVWARDLGEERNQKLLEYFADRKVWYINGTTWRGGLQLYSDFLRDGNTAKP